MSDDWEDVRSTLREGTSDERAAAATFLGKHGIRADVSALIKARVTESDEYVIRSIERAIAKLRALPAGSAPGRASMAAASRPPDDDELVAGRRVLGALLHELQPLIGLVRLSASSEIPDYPSSQVRRDFEKVDRFLQGISALLAARLNGPRVPMDVSATVDTVVEAFQREAVCTFVLTGPRPFVVATDTGLLELILRNAIANAVEAALSNSPSVPPSVVVRWDTTDEIAWILIADSGAGLLDSGDRVFQPWYSTKKEHAGIGLALVAEAARALGSRVELRQASLGGAEFELRMPLLQSSADDA